MTAYVSDSDLLDAALVNLDAIGDSMARSRHSHHPKGLNRWLTQMERNVRDLTGRIRDLRSHAPFEAALAERLQRMAAGYFG